jgi:hypothetical protein
MRKNTATLGHPSSTDPASGLKPTAVSVPVKPTPNAKGVSEEAIRQRAYQKWEAAGRPGGDGVNFWVEAERELLKAK